MSDWRELNTASISGRSPTQDFTGHATLYEYDGEKLKKQKTPRYAAVYKVNCKDPSALICGGEGYIGDAVKKAFGIKGRLGGANCLYKDWGKPVGKPTDGNYDKGKSALIIL